MFNKNMLSHIKKLSAFIQFFSLGKIPLLGFMRPQVVRLDEQLSAVKIPFGYVTKNHVGSMYFGALAMGAELSVALYMVDQIFMKGLKSQFIFKDFKAQFHKRAEKDIYFVCNQISELQSLCEKAAQTTERVEGTFHGYAVDDVEQIQNPQTKIMSYELTISLKAPRAK
jgi:hypothetical protein